MLPDLVLVDSSLLQTAREIGWRLDVPFHFRLIFQPLGAVLLGIRDGRLDAKAGTPPFLYDYVFAAEDRRGLFRGALASIWKPLATAVILDAVIQLTFLSSVSIAGALLIGGLLVGVPYVLVRGLVNRLVSRRQPDAPTRSPG
jgi:hypothetical protein